MELDESDYQELTGDDIPRHLRPDGLVGICNKCGRETTMDYGKQDILTQPNGLPCGGTFSDPRVE